MQLIDAHHGGKVDMKQEMVSHSLEQIQFLRTPISDHTYVSKLRLNYLRPRLCVKIAPVPNSDFLASTQIFEVCIRVSK